MATQQCAEPGCETLAAYGTRTKPAWCDEHITAILKRGGLEPLEPFAGPTAWRLTRCLRCGCEAHYRFVYTLDKNAYAEATCRACYWQGWAAQNRHNLAGYVDPSPDADLDGMRAFAEEHGYEHLGPLTSPSLRDDPHRVRCRYCGRISAERPADIGWGCSCQVNPRRSRMTSQAARVLLRGSDSPAVEWWDHGRNPADLWAVTTDRTRRAAWWCCPTCGGSFQARVSDMFGTPACPACRERERAARTEQYQRNKATSVADYPELLAAWADPADPATVMVGDYTGRRFRCANGHELTAFPGTYLASGCSVCRGRETRAANATIREAAFAEGYEIPGRTLNPELVEQWHPTRNGKLLPAGLSPGSRRVVWWREPSCGHEWAATPADREKRERLRCPECRTILDSLAYHYPDLAAEWSPDNPLTPWYVRPSAVLPFVPEWVCSTDPTHTWRVATSVRVNGSDCPLCRERGKSRVELLYFAAVRDALSGAFSGLAMRSPAFVRRSVWVPDVTVNLDDGRTLLIEYDGSYWHASKADVDLDKSCDLLAAGALVVRLREAPLPALGIEDPKYLELRVHSTMPEPQRIVQAIREWLAEKGRLTGSAVAEGRSARYSGEPCGDSPGSKGQ